MDTIDETQSEPQMSYGKKLEKQINLLQKFPLGTYWAKTPYQIDRKDLPYLHEYVSAEKMNASGIEGERMQIKEGESYSIDRYGSLYDFSDSFTEISKEEYEKIRNRAIHMHEFKKQLIANRQYLFHLYNLPLAEENPYKLNFDSLTKLVKNRKKTFDSVYKQELDELEVLKTHTLMEADKLDEYARNLKKFKEEIFENEKIYLFKFDKDQKDYKNFSLNINLFEINVCSLSSEKIDPTVYQFGGSDDEIHFLYKDWHLHLGVENKERDFWKSTVRTLIHTPSNNWRYTVGDEWRYALAYLKEDGSYRNGGIGSSLGGGDLYFISKDHFEEIKKFILDIGEN